MAGMNLFAPDTVAGYPAVYQAPDFDRQWFSSATILARYRMIECLITGRNALVKMVNLVPLLIRLGNSK